MTIFDMSSWNSQMPLSVFQLLEQPKILKSQSCVSFTGRGRVKFQLLLPPGVSPCMIVVLVGGPPCSKKEEEPAAPGG
jgi:hypothetical protein